MVTLSSAPERGPHRSRGVIRCRPRLLLLCILLGVAWLGAFSSGATARAPSGAGPVFIVAINGPIDLGLAPFLRRVIDEAEASDAQAVILDIDTPGGRLDAVLQMRDSLLDTPVPTIAFVNRTAFSAGALIAIAAEQIYMTPGAVIGAATPVDGTTGETASEKVVSAVRTTFKATAEARGRDPQVAEAMVDPNVVIDGLVARGELLTLTTDEATRWGYADGVAADRAALLAARGLSAAPIVERSPRLAEQAVRFVTDPLVASLLIILAVLLIVIDFFVEGFGALGVVGLCLLALFFWGHMLAGLAGWEDVALVLLGLILIAVEIVVVPGFGVPGVLGLAALIGGLFLAMLGREIRAPDGIERAALTVASSFVVIAIGVVVALILLPRRTRLSGLVLQSAAGGGTAAIEPRPPRWLGWFGEATGRPERDRAAEAMRSEYRPPEAPAPPLPGSRGVTVTALRPHGVAAIDGHQFEVVTVDDEIPAGNPIVVTAVDGDRYVVRRSGQP
ncbi:MAG: ATP-dependent Clp protease proteolytic subunit [Chloroflexota bacterium]|nr:ATP-dependent Clp protease proteolytic subunit [Chloroflexota bacterium]